MKDVFVRYTILNYDFPHSVSLDKLIEEAAKKFKGKWMGQGAGRGERDIQYRFSGKDVEKRVTCYVDAINSFKELKEIKDAGIEITIEIVEVEDD